MPPIELPVLQPITRAPRADAARNRERILCTARRLMAERGPEGVSMDCVAAEAGVGKGTLYRRFGDRNGLIRALIEDDERRFQDELIRGMPPLGPGAPAAERLHAFGHELLELVCEMAPYFVADDQIRGGPAQFYRMHLGVLLQEAIPDAPALEYLGDTMLVALSGPHVRIQMRKGMTIDELREGWHVLVDAVLATGAPQRAGLQATASAG